ncbi:MAG: hypothetical protein CSA53_03660 [Gammaproteobacteria bacterium]|nr:MAG: hypothetical protein CSA53_03660 [Gammaproteobacteria bacterium]
MKKLLLPLAVVSAVSLAACNEKSQTPAADVAPAAAEVALSTSEQRLSYGVAQNVAKQMKASGLPLDSAAFVAGFEDVMNDRPARMSDEEIAGEMQAYQAKMMEQKQAEMDKIAAENEQAGKAYLAENAKREGVKVTDSGLQYEVVKKGDGALPTASDRVVVHYAGRLIDGTEFDSSYARNEPAKFGVGQVIPGWTEALQMMPAGSKWKLTIPAELAYGAAGAGGRIPPNSTLVFDVELLEVEKAKTAKE